MRAVLTKILGLGEEARYRMPLRTTEKKLPRRTVLDQTAPCTTEVVSTVSEGKQDALSLRSNKHMASSILRHLANCFTYLLNLPTVLPTCLKCIRQGQGFTQSPWDVVLPWCMPLLYFGVFLHSKNRQVFSRLLQTLRRESLKHLKIHVSLGEPRTDD